jgi:hypothetical protein
MPERMLDELGANGCEVCEHCGDTGLVRSPGAEDYGVSFESEHCERCRLGRALIAVDAAEWERHEAQIEVTAHRLEASASTATRGDQS